MRSRLLLSNALRTKPARPLPTSSRLFTHRARDMSASKPTQEESTTADASASASASSTSEKKKPLALPEPAGAGEGDSSGDGSGGTISLNVGGEGVRLDHLGPLVVNEDGTMSRIGNWGEMSQIERDNTVRILGKRNQMRLKKLRESKGQGQGQ